MRTMDETPGLPRGTGAHVVRASTNGRSPMTGSSRRNLRAPPAPRPAPPAVTTTAAAAGQLHAAADVLPVEEIERGETDVGHFLFAENEALIGRGVVGLRHVGIGDRGRRRVTRQ